MAKILTIEGGIIKQLVKAKFNLESDLQDYLEKHPSIIPLEEIVEEAPELICIGREVAVPSGAIDLLYIDKEALLTVVETKLVKNPEIRRSVIGQIVEYASFACQWTGDYVYDIAANYLTVPLIEKLASIYTTDFDEEKFKHNLEDNLKNGRLRLIIAADELNEPLRVTITFLNSNSNFDILLLQLSNFEENKGKKVLISSLFGYAQKETGTPRTPPPKINEEIFLARCREGKHEKAVELYLKAKDLKESRKVGGDFINWGVSGYSYRMPWKGYPIGETLFTAYGDGKLQIWPDLSTRTDKAGKDYLDKLRHITSLTSAFSRLKYPTISTDDMELSDIDAFISAMKELGKNLDDISKGVTS